MPWDTGAYDTYTVMPDLRGSVSVCSLIGINSNDVRKGRLTSGSHRGLAYWKPEPQYVNAYTRNRRSAMHQSRTLDIGMDVHKDTIAVA
jgi:hypothetical protein